MPNSIMPRAAGRSLNFILTTPYEAGVLLSLFVRRENCGFKKRLTRSFSLQQVGRSKFQLMRSASKQLLVAMFLASYIISSHSSSVTARERRARSSLRSQWSLPSSCYMSGFFYVSSSILSFPPQTSSMK